jgi:phosphatidylserine/phosphatidylglycerophosphate/cardiolipin synthase-like enzyme
MKLSEYAIHNLQDIITGDKKLTPNLSGRDLVALFNKYGFRDIYRGAVPDGLSRNGYAESRMVQLSNKPELARLLEFIVSSSHFAESPGLSIKDAVQYINNIINEEGFALAFINGYYKVTGAVANTPEKVANTVHFEQIQSQILSELDKARFVIYVAVAWFTDPVLFGKLIEKRDQGVMVQILIIDDEINARAGLPFKGNFFFRRIPPTGYFKNIQHHKFCVIDLETVINGSYNWTTKAKFNEENITVSADRELAKTFAQRFIDIRLGKI